MKQDAEKKKLFKGYSLREKRNFPFIYICLILPVVHVIIFYFVVNFSAITFAFKDKSLNWSFESIERVFKAIKSNSDTWGYAPRDLIKKSVTIWFLSNVVANVVNIFVGLILTKHMIGNKVFRVIYYIPSIVGPVVFAGVMKEIYAYNGVIVEVLKNAGVQLDPAILKSGLLGNSDTALSTLMIQMFIMRITGADMILGSAYMKIPEEIFESAKIEGCGFFREAFQIAIPLIWPTLTTMITFSLCSFFTADYSMYLYSNGSGANGMVSVGFYLYRFQTLFAGSTDTNYLMGYVSAFGMFITIITVPVVLIGRKLLSMLNDNVEY